MEDISSLSIRRHSLIYKGLLALLDSESGYGFLNSDKGHPAYRNQPADYNAWGDDHEHNDFYNLLMSFRIRMEDKIKTEGGDWLHFDLRKEDVIRVWKQFCERAVNAYKKHQLN